jgi:hypothetical protein
VSSDSLEIIIYEIQTRLLTISLAITKNGVQKISAPVAPDLSLWKSDKKITDEEILKILELPLAKATTAKPKNKKKKKKAAKKAAPKEAEEDDEDEDDDDDEDDE